MFIVSKLPSYTWPVTVDFPIDGGVTRAVTFTAKFRRLEQTEINKQQQDITAGKIDDRSIVDQVLIGWDGVLDEERNPLPFNDANLDVVLQMFPVRPSIVRAYYDSLKAITAKN